jgi:hypothetical protein
MRRWRRRQYAGRHADGAADRVIDDLVAGVYPGAECRNGIHLSAKRPVGELRRTF